MIGNKKPNQQTSSSQKPIKHEQKFKNSNNYLDKYLKHYSPPNYKKNKKIDYLQEIIVYYK